MSLMYLEDYLELVSFLPQEFCDHLTKVRELDLEASNRRDNIEKLKEKIAPELFAKTRKTDSSNDLAPAKEPLSVVEKAALSAEISTEYDHIVQIGVEKVKIVTGLEELMLRYNRRLMSDTEKFKMELEADNPGITENLEARAEQDMKNLRDNIPTKVSPPEVRVPSSRRIADMGQIIAMQRQKQVTSKNSFSSVDQTAQRRVNVLQGNGNNMLARAASQAIAATQNLPTGRRTASLKASYEAAVRDTPTNLSRDQSIDRNDVASTSNVNSIFSQTERRKRQPQRKLDRFADDEDVEEANVDNVDEDNKLYCFCRQPSAGFMIACDNTRCAVEWFHGTCVGVTGNSGEVGGKWYCPDCRDNMARERERRMKSARGDGGIFKVEPGVQQFKQDHGKMTGKKQQRRPQ